MGPWHVARRTRVCSIVLSNAIAIFAVCIFALWYGMNSDKDNIHPLLTQLIPAGHCTCQSSTLFNCSGSDPIYGCPVSPPPSQSPAGWTYNYDRDHRNWGLTPSQCDNAFNGLFEDVNRAVGYWEDRQGFSTRNVDAIPIRDGMVRAAIHNGELYIIEAHAAQEDHRRKILAILSSINRALTTSTTSTATTDFLNRPNLKFVFSVEDKLEDVVSPRRQYPIWILGRKAAQESVFLMPDFGFWAWENKYNGIGPFDQVVDRVVEREKELPFDEKKKELVWRGKLSFAPKLRRALLDVARDQSWGDVKELVWTRKDNFLSLEEHCDYMFIAHVEGRAFSSSLKYRQACHSIVVAHELQYIQHHHYLLQPSGSQQNFVQVSRDFSDLSTTIEDLLSDPTRARTIADNNVKMFRERYLTQAAEACYWRALFSGYARVLNSDEKEETMHIDGQALRYESFILLPSTDMMDYNAGDVSA